jgi:NitT/TauT family transport system permease protein
MEPDEAAVLEEELEAPAPVVTALTAADRTRAPRTTSRWGGALTHILAVVGVIVIWWVITLFTPKFAFPTPQAVLKVMWEVLQDGSLWPNMSVTLRRTVLALIGAMVIGTTLGIVMGINKYWESFTRNWVYMALSMPGIVWVMLCVLWFGINEVALWISVVFIIFPYVAVNVFEGVKAIDRDLLDMGRSFKIKRREMVSKIIMPSLTPYLVAALRQNFANSWKMVTLAELFGASIGIGFMIRSGFEFFATAVMLAWVAWFAIVILAIEYGIIAPVRKYLLRWRPEMDEVI